MPAVHIKVFEKEKVVSEEVTSATGDFEIGIDPGEYTLEITAPGFQPYTSIVRIPVTAPLTLTMNPAQVTQSVSVTDTLNKVSLEADSSLNTTILDKDFADELPAEADDLTAYLQLIAGSRGGAGDELTFIVDGFTSGRIPPKEQIQEIRINTNPYSAEFSGVALGRTEIVSKAGTGDYTGMRISCSEMLRSTRGIHLRQPNRLINSGISMPVSADPLFETRPRSI